MNRDGEGKSSLKTPGSVLRKLGGGFKYFLFSSLFGEDSHFDSYFSNGLKPPTRKGLPVSDSDSFRMGLKPETSYSFREGSGSLGLILPWIPKLKMYETSRRMGSLHKLFIF